MPLVILPLTMNFPTVSTLTTEVDLRLTFWLYLLWMMWSSSCVSCFYSPGCFHILGHIELFLNSPSGFLKNSSCPNKAEDTRTDQAWSISPPQTGWLCKEPEKWYVWLFRLWSLVNCTGYGYWNCDGRTYYLDVLQPYLATCEKLKPLWKLGWFFNRFVSTAPMHSFCLLFLRTFWQ